MTPNVKVQIISFNAFVSIISFVILVFNQRMKFIVMKRIDSVTTAEEQEFAESSITQLSTSAKKIDATGQKVVRISISTESEHSIYIPKKAFFLLVDAISSMARGRSVVIIDTDSELSTQEAADMLKVSRPYLIKLLDQGQIPYRKVGSHRRILMDDIIEYNHRLKEAREKQLRYLAKQAQELGLGYE